jgi:prepilin-type N-terminal cleavage/methylation domain-containing protein
MNRRAFSLIEVIAATALFATGTLLVARELESLAGSMAAAKQARVAAALPDAVHARLTAMQFEDAARLIQEPGDPSLSDYGFVGSDPTVILFGTAHGEVGAFDALAGDWFDATGARIAGADRQFAIALIRNVQLSPNSTDADAAYIAFELRIRWPVAPTAVSAAESVTPAHLLISSGFLSR